MAKCLACKSRGHGIQGLVLIRVCCICQRQGCDKCLNLYHVIVSTSVSGSGNQYIGEHQYGCCSQSCYEQYITSEITRAPLQIINPKLLQEEGDNKILFTKILGQPEFYQATLIWIMKNFKTLDAVSVKVLSSYMDKPLAQGLIMMYEGHNLSDYVKITEGLKLCRTDPTYNNKETKEWIAPMAMRYLTCLDKSVKRPTTTAKGQHVTIELSLCVTKVEFCPSCGANINKIVHKGEIIKCDYCGSVIRIM